MPSADKQKEAFSSIDRDCLMRARSSIKEQFMDRVSEFSPTPQMPWINLLLGKRPDEAMSGLGMLGRRCNRKEAEEKLQQSDEYLSLGQRLRYAGTSGWSVLRTQIVWSAETFFVCEYDRPNGEQRESPRGRMDAENVAALETLFSSGANGPPHRPGVKKTDPRGSRPYQFPSALQSGQRKLKNFPIYIPRMDGKRKK
jgi:hypothetical protein